MRNSTKLEEKISTDCKWNRKGIKEYRWIKYATFKRHSKE